MSAEEMPIFITIDKLWQLLQVACDAQRIEFYVELTEYAKHLYRPASLQ